MAVSILTLITQQPKSGLASIMSIDRLFQSTGVSDATVDKLLGANFLSLALIALVMVVAMFLLFVWMNNRRQIADDKRQEVFNKMWEASISILTDESSPLVQNSKHAAVAIDIANQRSEAQTTALDKLSDNTDEQTKMLSGLRSDVANQTTGLKDFTNFQKINNDQLVGLSEDVNALRNSMDAFSLDLKAAIDSKTVCVGHEETMGKILYELVSLRTYFGNNKRSTGTIPAVTPELNKAAEAGILSVSKPHPEPPTP